MRQSKISLVLGLLFLVALADLPAADENIPAWQKSYPNIEQVYGDFTLRLFLERPDFTIQIVDQNNEAPRIKYVPNVFTNLGAGIAFEDMGLSYGIAFGDPSEPESEVGNTDYFDFQFYYNAKWFGVDFYYQNYDGFYLDNAGELGETEIVRPDIGVTALGLNFYYVWDSEWFSMIAAFQQSEKMVRSGGSFLIMQSNNYISIEASRSLITSDEQVSHADLVNVTGAEFFTFGLAPGYAYTYKFYDLSVTAALFLGPAFQRQSFLRSGEDIGRYMISFKANVRGSIWYDFPDAFLGLYLIGDITQAIFSQSSYEFSSVTLQLFSGMRFWSDSLGWPI